jgi:hypothetical protein
MAIIKIMETFMKFKIYCGNFQMFQKYLDYILQLEVKFNFVLIFF